jgi:DNA-binding GntR family transcriptional regulator
MPKKTEKPRSLAYAAYETIREQIFNNTFRQGELLSESALSQELGMSRTPVREALRMLASENLVEVRNGVGIFIKPITLQDIHDLFEVRCALEMLAAKTAIYQISVEEADALSAQFTDLIQRQTNGPIPDPKEFVALDWKLHELLVERSGNEYVKSIVRNIHSNVRRYLEMSFLSFNDATTSAQEHLQILALIRARNRDGLSAALNQHLQWSAGFLLHRGYS